MGKAHSLRIGSAFNLFEMKSAKAVKVLGGWASAVFRNYVYLIREQRSTYVRHMSEQRTSGTFP